MKKKERKSAINGFRLCIDKLLTWVSGLPRSTATSIHPFVQYAKVTLLEISPCQGPMVKRSGVAYSSFMHSWILVFTDIPRIRLHTVHRRSRAYGQTCVRTLPYTRTQLSTRPLVTGHIWRRNTPKVLKKWGKVVMVGSQRVLSSFWFWGGGQTIPWFFIFFPYLFYHRFWSATVQSFA